MGADTEQQGQGIKPCPCCGYRPGSPLDRHGASVFSGDGAVTMYYPDVLPALSFTRNYWDPGDPGPVVGGTSAGDDA